MHALADCNNSPYLHIFPHGIGSFSTELLQSNSLTNVPVLPESVRKSHQGLVEAATEQATKALDMIKEQLCNEGASDYEKLMEAIGIFFQQAESLDRERRRFTSSQPEE